MQDVPIEVRRGALRLSTDRQHLDHAAVLALLRTTYWGSLLTPEVLARALQNSICFAVFDGPTLIAFGRAVTDLATYAYWTDEAPRSVTARPKAIDRQSTRLNSSHPSISYAVFCLKK